MPDTPERGLATTWLVTVLRGALGPDTGVGDGIAPEHFGWPSGQPGVGTFKPYLVVKPMPATPQRTPQPLGAGQAQAWLLPYLLTGWGEVREQADFICDMADKAICGVDVRALRDDNLPIPDFAVQLLDLNPLGAAGRDDKVSPPAWSRTDNCTIWVARAQPRRRG